mgnify:CR=1 FL=1
MKIGDEVGWQWGSGLAMGEVIEIHAKRAEIESKGKHIVRNGSNDDPAVVIRADNGSKVIKLAHEIQVVKGGEHV